MIAALDNLFFTADTHGGHGLMVERRGFKSGDEMDSTLIRVWNETVPVKGTVFHLGDFSFHKREQAAAFLRALNGTIHLVTGNHDAVLMKPEVRTRFASMTPMHGTKVLRLDGRKVILCHFPYAVWYAAQHGAWHLHGHSHGSSPRFGRRYDVGVDCNGLRPVPYRQLERILGDRPIEVGDGHKPRGERG